jgi:large subunit ribosomal protein L25
MARDNQGQPVKVEASALRRIISRMGSSAIFDAEYNGKPRLIMLKEVQSEPVGGNVLHVDLFEISADETVTTTVPLVAVGIEGITGGGNPAADDERSTGKLPAQGCSQGH